MIVPYRDLILKNVRFPSLPCLLSVVRQLRYTRRLYFGNVTWVPAPLDIDVTAPIVVRRVDGHSGDIQQQPWRHSVDTECCQDSLLLWYSVMRWGGLTILQTLRAEDQIVVAEFISATRAAHHAALGDANCRIICEQDPTAGTCAI